MSLRAFAEIDEGGKRVNVHFPYDPRAVRAIKAVPGRRFIAKENGGPYWAVPLDLKTMRLLREEFGLGLELGALLKRWGKDQVRRERNLMSMAHADDAELKRLPDVLPDLAGWLRPYQRADVAFMSQQSLCNTNQPGLGKTVCVIGAIYEAGLEDGAHLVVAPATSLRTVWQEELERWTDAVVLTGDTPDERRAAVEEAYHLHQAGLPFWLIINPALVRYANVDCPDCDEHPDCKRCAGKGKYPEPQLPELERVDWASVTLDEYHKMGLNNPKTLGAMAFAKLGKLARRRYALSGTPTGGVPMKLWAVLNWLYPEAFTSKWQWIGQWLETHKHEFGTDIGGIIKGREPEFYRAHAQYIIRRTKDEVLKDLPPKQYVDVWCQMTPKQAKQYNKFYADAEIKIGDKRLVATSILAEYTRLKQFASARQEFDGDNLSPLPESGKLEPLFDNIEDRLLEGEKVIVASQSLLMADMVAQWLSEQTINGEPIRVAMITGAVKGKDRAANVREFQKGSDIQVMVMTTTAGGVSITLDAADSVHILDETWNPDDQEQLEDRAHRASRMHQVTIYNYRMRDTIEEYIYKVAEGKAINNKNILDIHRKIVKAKSLASA